LPAPIVNGEEIVFENGRIPDFQGLVTLTLDWVITAYRHASLCVCGPIITKIFMPDLTRGVLALAKSSTGSRTDGVLGTISTL